MTTLTGPSRPAQSGKATSNIVFLHGYGADGNDLIGLAEPLAPHLPNAAFFAPNAPARCGLNPMGYQWFPIPHMDGSSQEQAVQGMIASAQSLNDWLDALATDTDLGAERTVLVGFSQGTMMSLHVAPRRPEPVAAIVGFSGRLMMPGQLAAEAISKPPVLLIHGDQDEVVPHASMGEAAAALSGAGFDVSTHTSPGTAHGIAPDGLGLALSFIRAALGEDQG
ncbi:alpha/beta hydrolase [Oceanibium sediminis]|uniref:alpha/beta hydrolase n=1 Tax=Oceanibium sediminis TaxID=2026339 RepID=UPI000DD354ED|nr:alpha/beta fold hydrolase [Oceanibium sediminis]